MKERDLILSALLEKYENSRHLTAPGTSARRVMLRIEKKELPAYDYQTAESRDRFNQAAKALEKKGIVLLEWYAGRPVLEKIILRLDAVSDAYALLGRLHPKQMVEQVCGKIRDTLSEITVPWILAWGAEVCEKAEESYRIPSYCKDIAYLEGLLRVFAVYDGLRGGTITMRAFSIRCFQNSKRFEQEYRNEFLRIAQQYQAELGEICREQEIGIREKLAFLGIYARPELYEFSGNCRMLTEKGEIDLSAMEPWGIAVPSTAVEEIRSFCMDGIEKVIFIENKTNYDDYLLRENSPEELVVYHGGFLSPKKRELFRKIAEGCKEGTKICFWGDIDLGGFQMFEHLQRWIPDLQPMRMSADDFMKYQEYGLERNGDYLARLKEAMEHGKYPLFADVMRKILESGVTIEQEVFL